MATLYTVTAVEVQGGRWLTTLSCGHQVLLDEMKQVGDEVICSVHELAILDIPGLRRWCL